MLNTLQSTTPVVPDDIAEIIDTLLGDVSDDFDEIKALRAMVVSDFGTTVIINHKKVKANSIGKDEADVILRNREVNRISNTVWNHWMGK